jgi:hypothetical protein
MLTSSPLKAHLNDVFIFPPPHLIIIKLKMFQYFLKMLQHFFNVSSNFSSTFYKCFNIFSQHFSGGFLQHFFKLLPTFRQHYINVPTFLVNIFLKAYCNIFLEAYSNIFKKCWFSQLFFVNILKNVGLDFFQHFQKCYNNFMKC